MKFTDKIDQRKEFGQNSKEVLNSSIKRINEV